MSTGGLIHPLPASHERKENSKEQVTQEGLQVVQVHAQLHHFSASSMTHIMQVICAVEDCRTGSCGQDQEDGQQP